jgi:hypothetical protein
MTRWAALGVAILVVVAALLLVWALNNPGDTSECKKGRSPNAACR